MDASGGWWDAGDCLRFVETTSYTVDLMLPLVRDFPSQAGPGFTAQAKFGTDWLMKMWNDSTKTMYYQVGIASCVVTAAAIGAWPLRWQPNRPIIRFGWLLGTAAGGWL